LDSPIHFSIVIPTFNRGQLVSQTIKSILKQQDILFEVIVVDDGSEDDTSALISELQDKRIKYFKTENRERGAARNSGTLIANGNYINYFDSDDILNPCLADLRMFIVENNFPDVVYGLIENISEKGNSLGVVKPAYTDFKKAFLHNNFLACGSVFIKREVALKNPFSEDRELSGTEDWELWLRLYAAHDFMRFPKVVFQQRHHDQRSITKVPSARVVLRETAFTEHINQNRKSLSKRFTSSQLDLLVADRYTLIALSLCELPSKKYASSYLLRSLRTSWMVLGRKRFWAILKKLILG
jgi:glycosyltransferase involved in cell wall biosynthesis